MTCPRPALAALPILLTLLCLPTGCGVNRQFTDIGQCQTSHDAAGLSALTIRTRVGNVHLEASPGPNVEVTAQVRVEESRAEQMRPAAAARDLRIAVVSTRLIIEDAHYEAADKNDWMVTLHIKAPESLLADLIASSGVGNVELSGSGQSVQADTGVGNLRVHGSYQQAKVHSGVGDVFLEGNCRSVDLQTGTGNIHANTPDLLGGIAKTGVGDIEIISLAAPDADLTCTIGTGNVNLVLPAAFTGRFELSTGVGRVAAPASLGGTRKDSVTSQSVRGGDSGPKISATTGVGSVTWR